MFGIECEIEWDRKSKRACWPKPIVKSMVINHTAVSGWGCSMSKRWSYMEPIFHLIFKLVHSTQSSVNIYQFLRLSQNVCSCLGLPNGFPSSILCLRVLYNSVYTSVILNRIQTILCIVFWGVCRSVILEPLAAENRMFLSFRHLQIETQNHRVSLAKVNYPLSFSFMYLCVFLRAPTFSNSFSLVTVWQ